MLQITFSYTKPFPLILSLNPVKLLYESTLGSDSWIPGARFNWDGDSGKLWECNGSSLLYFPCCYFCNFRMWEHQLQLRSFISKCSFRSYFSYPSSGCRLLSFQVVKSTAVVTNGMFQNGDVLCKSSFCFWNKNALFLATAPPPSAWIWR